MSFTTAVLEVYTYVIEYSDTEDSTVVEPISSNYLQTEHDV